MSASAEAIERAAARLGPRARRDVPLGPSTTYRVGGPAALFVEVDDEETLEVLAEAVRTTGVPVLVVGRGSNLLVADAGFAGVAVVLGERFAQVEIDGDRVTAGGAAALPVVARRTAAAGLCGFEWAVGVPGSIGGAVRMNAGGHGSDMAEVLVGVRVLDLEAGEDVQVPAADLDLGYRRSAIGPSQVVLTADLQLERGDRARSEALIADIVRWRREHQPGGPNAGSVFTNPPGDSAGRLVDEAGARGLRLGSAQVSPKHANFIQADEGGRAADIVALMVEVRRRVEAHAGIHLEIETRLAGFDDAVLSPNPRPEIEGS
ncbi:MAG: UDP-N-acetylmuramate dehydrogenase [Acidimicrobiales bacterium]